MPQPAPHLAIDFTTYLAWEQQQPSRHEFVNGEIFAMAGASDQHNEIAGNLYTLLRQHLRGTPCRAFMTDVKVRIEAANCCFYPDVHVTCHESDRADRLVKRAPVLLAEVLSDSTAAYDLGDKFAAYQQLDSLHEYVLVDQARIRVQLYRRREGRWWVENIGPGQRLRLESVMLDCPVEALYQDLSTPLAVQTHAPQLTSTDHSKPLQN